jgi:hypothetical protein
LCRSQLPTEQLMKTLDETTDEPVDERTDPMYGDTTSSAGKSLISLLGITTTLVAALAI